MTTTIALDCGTCLRRIRVDPADARRELRERGEYGFGLHVTDVRAFAMRWIAVRRGWRYEGGQIGKTTVTMVCSACLQRKRAQHPNALVLDEDSELEIAAEEIVATMPAAPPEGWAETLAQSIIDAERTPPTSETAAVPPEEK